jgi:hypothetical protein
MSEQFLEYPRHATFLNEFAGKVGAALKWQTCRSRSGL